jgi:hypothetical protein
MMTDIPGESELSLESPVHPATNVVKRRTLEVIYKRHIS